MMNTPFGPDLHPKHHTDKETGIGDFTDDDF